MAIAGGEGSRISSLIIVSTGVISTGHLNIVKIPKQNKKRALRTKRLFLSGGNTCTGLVSEILFDRFVNTKQWRTDDITQLHLVRTDDSCIGWIGFDVPCSAARSGRPRRRR